MTLREQPLPMVTVAVLCYNHARFVIEALESVKAQAYPNLHLVVLDDCSTDSSPEIIRQWLDRNSPDAVFVEHKNNLGVCRTANEAMANAKGKYLRILSADDRWIPNTLLRQVATMEAASEDVGVLYSDAFQMTESGELLPNMFIEAHRSFVEMPEGWIFDALLEGNFIPGMTAVVRRSCLEIVGGTDPSLTHEDWDLWLRISRQFKFKYFPEPTAHYRIVQTSMTQTLHAELLDSEQRIVAKCLRRGWLTGNKKKDALYLEACRAYRQGLPNSALEAARAFRNRVCIRHALLLLAVVGRLPYHRYEQLIALLTHVKRRAKLLLADGGLGQEPR